MKVLLLNQFFHPDLSATAQLATDLAEDLASAGMEVTALAACGAYLGGRLPEHELHHGVRIERVRSTALGKRSVARRLADYASFYLLALAKAFRLERSDVVIAMSTPPLVASLGALLRQARGTRFVYWLQDVYPDLAVEFGVLGRTSLATRLFRLLSVATLKRADAVVVLGEAMAERVRAAGVSAERVHVIPNWSDGRSVCPVAASQNAFLAEHGLQGKRVVLYSGNMGRGHDLDTLLRAARLLRHEEGLVFLFVGDGARRSLVEAAARELPAVRLLSYQPRARLAESLSSGDVHVVTQDRATLGLLEPSKVYGVMAAGRPVLFIGPEGAEAGQTVLREGAGEVVANGDAAGAAGAILRLLAAAPNLGDRARQAFMARYDRPMRTSQFAALLRTLLA